MSVLITMGSKNNIKRSRTGGLSRGFVAAAFICLGNIAFALPGEIIILSQSYDGFQAYESCVYPSTSTDGRFVAFVSAARNLVFGDTNGYGDVFVRDTLGQTTVRISVSSFGEQADHQSGEPSISADGRFVAFFSQASNLVPGDTNGGSDVFVHDMWTGTTQRVSIGTSGQEGFGQNPAISANGRYVAFVSGAPNLVQNDTNSARDMFVRDLMLGVTTRVSVSSTGEQGNDSVNQIPPALSADGRYVAFQSWATNLVAGDTNNWADLFLRDTVLGTTTRVSVSSSGTQANHASGNPKISADGRVVAFLSYATNLVSGDTNGVPDIFVRDLDKATTKRVSVSTNGIQSNGESSYASISADGRYIAFGCQGNNIVTSDTNGVDDVFLHDRSLNTTVRVSVNESGQQGNGYSYEPSLSPDASFVAFQSTATNFVPSFGGLYNIYRSELAGVPGPVKVKLVFSNWSGPALPQIADYVLRRTAGTIIDQGAVNISPEGVIEVPRPAPGNYELLIRTWVFLQRKVAFVQETTTVDLGIVSLINGDCDGDNVISVFDYLILSSAFDSTSSSANWNIRADLDGDGVVGLFDYLIMSDNFDQRGED